MPTIDLLTNTSSVPPSDGRLDYAERSQIRPVLDALEGDATCNAKLALLQASLPRLPSRLTRPQAEALLRTLSIPMRRVNAIHILRDRIPSGGGPAGFEAWADEICGQNATTERIRELCGDDRVLN